MRIVSKTAFVPFCLKHGDGAKAINEWYDKTKAAKWQSLKDIKNTFNSVDYVGGDRYVFNIKGNKYRLITMIFFKKQTVYIRFIGTHGEYDAINDCSTA